MNPQDNHLHFSAWTYEALAELAKLMLSGDSSIEAIDGLAEAYNLSITQIIVKVTEWCVSPNSTEVNNAFKAAKQVNTYKPLKKVNTTALGSFELGVN